MMEIGKMASKKLYIVESLLGGKNIYDESGKLVGYSVKAHSAEKTFMMPAASLPDIR